MPEQEVDGGANVMQASNEFSIRRRSMSRSIVQL
jgi:hypothetical protein